ncbi:hypothetical protein Tco_1016821 [Tanacetum coccineum]|uniref:Uncharacterized protein n=1 Tax=Tanacetum coccineum TaxID=301880 RepID=A0ABQ5FPV2_9ASTR
MVDGKVLQLVNKKGGSYSAIAPRLEIAETFDWDEEEVTSDDDEMVEVKVLVALSNDEKMVLGKSMLEMEQLKEETHINEKWLNSSDKMSFDHEMIPKSKDWVERLNPDSKLPNFNIARILVLESQAVNKSLGLTEVTSKPESSKELVSEP